MMLNPVKIHVQIHFTSFKTKESRLSKFWEMLKKENEETKLNMLVKHTHILFCKAVFF